MITIEYQTDCPECGEYIEVDYTTSDTDFVNTAKVIECDNCGQEHHIRISADIDFQPATQKVA